MDVLLQKIMEEARKLTKAERSASQGNTVHNSRGVLKVFALSSRLRDAGTRGENLRLVAESNRWKRKRQTSVRVPRKAERPLSSFRRNATFDFLSLKASPATWRRPVGDGISMTHFLNYASFFSSPQGKYLTSKTPIRMNSSTKTLTLRPDSGRGIDSDDYLVSFR